MKIVYHTVPMALSRLGYSDDQVNDIVKYIDEQETIEGAPHIATDHLQFSTARLRQQTVLDLFTIWDM